MEIIECFRVTPLRQVTRADVVQRHVERALVAEFLTESACLEIEIKADFVMTEIYMSHTQPVKDQRGQFSVAHFLTEHQTLFVQLKCKLVSPLCIMNNCH